MSSVVAAFYYIRLIKLMFFEMSSKRFTLYKQMDQVNAYVLSISLLLLLIFFVSFDRVFLSCYRVGLYLFLYKGFTINFIDKLIFIINIETP